MKHLAPDAHLMERLGDDRASFARLGGMSQPDLGEVERLAHRLAGAAGIFGFTALGEIAATVEAEAQNASQGNGLALKAKILNLIAALDEILDGRKSMEG